MRIQTRMVFRSLVTLLSCGSLAAGANAETWVPVGGQKHGLVMLNSDSVQTTPAGISVWLKLKPSADDDRVSYELDHWSIDCRK